MTKAASTRHISFIKAVILWCEHVHFSLNFATHGLSCPPPIHLGLMSNLLRSGPAGTGLFCGFFWIFITGLIFFVCKVFFKIFLVYNSRSKIQQNWDPYQNRVRTRFGSLKCLGHNFIQVNMIILKHQAYLILILVFWCNAYLPHFIFLKVSVNLI